MDTKREIGKLGEKIACWYLTSKGYEIVQTNYYTRYGEIDIVCQKDNALVFIEVKTRTNFSFGQPEDSISQKKIQNLTLAINQYLIDYKYREYFRLDLLAIFIDSNKRARIKHLVNISWLLDNWFGLVYTDFRIQNWWLW